MQTQPTEDILSLPPAYKLYSDRAIALATFLGGPLVGGYLAAENFKQLGAPRKVRTAWIAGIAALVIILGGMILVPDISRVPSYIIPLFYTGVTQVLIQRSQGSAIKAHVENKGLLYSLWRAALVGLIGAAITLAVIFAIVYFFFPDELS